MNYKRWNELQEKANSNEVIEGTVKSIKPYGAFIETKNGIVGLLPIEDMCISRIRTPYDRFQIGDEVQVKVKEMDDKRQRVTFTHKELLGSWEENAKKMAEGMKTVGIVREKEKNKNGIFIELEPNLVGMAEYDETMEYGQKVDVYVKKIIPEKRKIKLVILKEKGAKLDVSND